MNRKEITAFLSELLIDTRLRGIGKHYAQEVSLNWGTNREKRVDFMEFIPENQLYVSGIEKGIFICYEIKSCKADVFSGNGLNFFGEKNYIVTTMQTWKDIQEDFRNGNFLQHLDSCSSPDSTKYYGVMVAVPVFRDKIDEFEDPTPLDREKAWKLEIILPCHQGYRKKSTTELLFSMLRAK